MRPKRRKPLYRFTWTVAQPKGTTTEIRERYCFAYTVNQARSIMIERQRQRQLADGQEPVLVGWQIKFTREEPRIERMSK